MTHELDDLTDDERANAPRYAESWVADPGGTHHSEDNGAEGAASIFAKALMTATAEVERLTAHNRKLWQERYDALSVTSRDGLLSSEWVARTGKAERERDEALESVREANREIYALETRRDELLALAAKLTREVPYEEESANVATLIAKVGTLKASIRTLHDQVDLTDPNDPVGAALMRAGLDRRP